MSDEKKKVKRRAVSKKLRFEVFKRDSFTCQYCGRKAPDIIPFNTARAVHTNLLVVWLLTGFMGAA